MAGLALVRVRDTFAVSKLPAGSPIPDWALRGSLISVTRTEGELSIVCPESDVPVDVLSERGWRCLRVAGQLDLAQVGILASLVGPLAEAGVAVFVVSTFDTDILLVRSGDLERAEKALHKAGHRVMLDPGSQDR
jgi:hypothetical protein